MNRVKPVRRMLWLVAALLIAQPAYGVSTEAEIRAEVRQFQQFFQSRFPDLPLDAYKDGVSALPQYAPFQLNQELLLAFPAYETELKKGQQAWTKPLVGDITLASCFAGKPPPTAYPYFFDGVLQTVESDINQCRQIHDLAPLDPIGAEMARLVAAFKAPWSGQPMDIDYRDEEVRRLYDLGRQAFWAKRGQMNLSCANCHVHNAGNQIRGEVLSAALGHGTGYPAYSYRWALQDEDEPMGTLHRRYGRCYALTGAAPLAAQSETYLALELYQAIMNTGIPVKVPSLRP